jgi:PKD repeat protein
MGAYELQTAVYLYPLAQSASNVPGAIIEYSLTFFNWSPLTDTYALALGPHAWPSELSTLQVGPLGPGEAVSFTVSVSIPPEAPWYLTDTVAVTATSLANPTLYQAAAWLNSSIFSVAPAEITLNGPQIGLASHPYTFTAAVSPISATLPIIYHWLPEEGQPPITPTGGLSDTASLAWAAPGIYTLTVSAVNYRAAVSNTLVIAISDEAISGLQASGDDPTIFGEATHFTATVDSGTNVIYSWNFGDGATGSGAITTHTYAAYGYYLVTAYAENSVSAQSAQFYIHIVDIPVTGLQAGNDGPTLIGETTLFTATVEGGSNVTYSWDFGDGTTGSGATITHTYTTAGIYVVTVTAENTEGWQTDTTSVTVFAYLVYLPLTLR